jgi:hypothetical protein
MVTIFALAIILGIYVKWVRSRAYWSATLILKCFGHTSYPSLKETMRVLEANPEAFKIWQDWYSLGHPLALSSVHRQTLMMVSALYKDKPIPNRYLKSWLK